MSRKKMLGLCMMLLIVLALSATLASAFAFNSTYTRGMFGYYNNSATPQYRVWNGTNFSSQSAAIVVNGSPEWTVVKASYAKDEKIMGTLTSTGVLNAQVWNGTAWTSATNMTAVIGTTNDDYRGFDIAYETNSSRALVVYNNNTQTPSYRIWNGTAFSAESSLQSDSCTGTPVWIIVASHPRTNEIVEVDLDTNGHLCSQTWNGTAWTNVRTFDTGSTIYTTKSFDVDYEQSSGEALVVWQGSTDGQMRYNTMVGGSWGTSANAGTNIGSRITWVDIASMNGTNRSMMGTYQFVTQDIFAIEWNGTAWGTSASIDTTTEEAGNGVVTVGYIGSTGNAMLVYVDNNYKYPSYVTCTGAANCFAGTWSLKADVPGATNCGEASDLDFVQLYNDRFTSRLMLTATSQANHFKCSQEYNGTGWASWTANIGSGLSLESGRDFGFAYDLFKDFDVPKLTNFSIVPALNLTYFGIYNLTVNATDTSGIDFVNVTYKGYNADGVGCFQYYVNGSCISSSWSAEENMTKASGNTYLKTGIRPYNIYPEIKFADEPIYWNNGRNYSAVFRDNYHLLKFTNNYTTNTNTSFWIEFDASPLANRNLQVYLFDRTANITTFQSDWTNSPKGEIVATLTPADVKNHNHTENSSHYLITLQTNSNGTVGTKGLNISGSFFIVLYTTSPQSNGGWNLSYRNYPLCNTSNWWTGVITTWATAQQSGCPDVHTHVIRKNVSGSSDGMIAKSCAKDIYENTNCTADSYFLFGDLGNLPPVANSILVPLVDTTYGCPLNLSWNAFLDPNGDNVTYNISLLNTDKSFNRTINSSLMQASYVWNCSSVPDGNYSLIVEGKDSYNTTDSTTLEGNFTIDHTAPQFNTTATRPVAGTYYNQSESVQLLVSVDENSTVTANVTMPSGSTQAVTLAHNGTNWHYNYTFTNTSLAGNYTILYNATDVFNHSNTTATSFIVRDQTPPTLTQTTPDDNAVDADGNVYFNCTAADNIGLANVSLYINGIINRTTAVSGTSNLTNFTVYNLSNGNYTWYCGAFDTDGNWNKSLNRTVQVNKTVVPTSTNFTGNTTDWQALPDISNVCNGTAIIDKPTSGMITWLGCVDARSQNFDAAIYVSQNLININTSGLHSTFNSTATLRIRNLSWDAPPLVLIDGVLCNESICSNVSYNTTTKEAVFNVTHFTNYTTTGNSQMSIWDETDPDKNNLTKYPGESIRFYSNYSKKTDNSPITGAACTINFTDSSAAMAYNATSTYYEYSRSFTSTGTKPFNVTCTAAGYQTIALSDSANVSADNVKPYFFDSETRPVAGTNYNHTNVSLNVPLQVNVSENVTVYANITCPNGTTQRVNLSYNGTAWYFTANHSNVTSVGRYNITFNATDYSGNSNTTTTYFLVNDVTSPAWAEEPQNQTSEYGAAFYYDVNATDPGGIDRYSINDTSNFAINATAGIIRNATSLAVNVYWLNISVNDTAGNNLSSAIYVNVSDTTAPTVAIYSPLTTTYNYTNISINFTATDLSSIDKRWYNPNGTNITYTGEAYFDFADNQTHTLYAYANDTYNNVGTNNVTFTVNTSASDTQPPAISAVQNQSTTNQSTYIVWTTDEAANSTVNYGTSLALGSYNRSASYVTSHNRSLSGLSENTTYYYNVTSCDLSGNCNTTGPYNFTTSDLTAPTISGVSASVTTTTAQVSWTTNEAANSTVNYGTALSLGSYERNASYNTSHSTDLAGLSSSTLYYYNVTSCDSSGNCRTAGVYNFTTSTEAAPSGGGGGGGTRYVPPVKNVTVAPAVQVCMEDWVCDDWGVCNEEGFQERDCYDWAHCGTVDSKPVTARNCVTVPAEGEIEEAPPETEVPVTEKPEEAKPRISWIPFILLALILIGGAAVAYYPRFVPQVHKAYAYAIEVAAAPAPAVKEWLWWKAVPAITEKAKISEFKVKGKKDFKEVLNFMREGPTVVFISTKEMRLGEMEGLKSSVKALKKTVNALNGDVLGLGMDYIVATSFGIRIAKPGASKEAKQKREEESESEKE